MRKVTKPSADNVRLQRMGSKEGGVRFKASVLGGCQKKGFDEAAVQDETMTQWVTSYFVLGRSTGCAQTRIYVQHTHSLS